MRVTQSMMNNQLMANLMANNQRLSKYQDILASGRKLNKPSDDPVGVGYAMRYEAQLARNEQYKQNVSAAISQYEFLDTTLGQVNDVLQRARELAVRGATGSLAPEDRLAVAAEVEQLHEQLVSLGNSKLNDRHIFNGHLTDLQPFDSANAQYQQTDSGLNMYTMSEGVSMAINTDGDSVFGPPTTPGNEATSDNAFAALQTLVNGLKNNDPGTINGALGNLSNRLDKLQQTRADVGARMNRVELLNSRLNDLDTNIQSLLSKTVDADIAVTITNLKTAEAVQRASMAAGTRVIQPTLVDFLR